MKKRIGIYKITSPSGRVYIGQSVNIDKRFNTYRLLKCKGQTKLYNSFMKYGHENHVFEVVEVCSEKDLNKRERYYQEKYNVIHPKKGLNCSLVKTSENKYVFCDETLLKLSVWQKGVPKPKEQVRKMSESKKGKKQTLEHRLKGAKSRTGLQRNREQRKRISESLKGKNGKIVFDTKSFVFTIA